MLARFYLLNRLFRLPLASYLAAAVALAAGIFLLYGAFARSTERYRIALALAGLCSLIAAVAGALVPTLVGAGGPTLELTAVGWAATGAGAVLALTCLILGWAGVEGGGRRLLVVLAALIMAAVIVLSNMAAAGRNLALTKETLALSLIGALVMLAAAIAAYRDLARRIAHIWVAAALIAGVVAFIAVAAGIGWQVVWSATGSYVWSLLGALAGPFVLGILAAFGLSLLSADSGPDWLVIILKK
jgi:hypothetical protein